MKTEEEKKVEVEVIEDPAAYDTAEHDRVYTEMVTRQPSTVIVGAASREPVVEQRRKKLLEMIMARPTENWSVRFMAQEARKLPWFREHMPSYGYATAHRDYLAIKEETKAKREQLAEQYLVSQLDSLEEALYDVASDIISLGGLNEMIAQVQDDYRAYTETMDEDSAAPLFDRLREITKFVKSKEALYNTMLRLQKRQGALVPMEVPRELNVTQQTINLDMFIEARKQMALQGGPKLKELPEETPEETIDGDYTE